MKKILPILLIIILTIICCTGFCFNKELTNEEALKSEKERVLLITNNTGEIINEVIITTGEGILVDRKDNPDDKDIKFIIDDAYMNYKDFRISFVDNYGFKYEKVVTDVSEKGCTTIEMENDNLVDQKGDWKRKLDKWFN